MRFLKGDVIGIDRQPPVTTVVTEDCDGMPNWRLLRTAREEWERMHWADDGEHRVIYELYPDCGCPDCGRCPTDPRPASEIAALKAGKDVEPVLTREEWDRTHKVWGVSDCEYSVDLEPGNIPCCVHCGPRPPAQPVATEPAALKAGKAAARAPQMDRETWDQNHTLFKDEDSGIEAHGVHCDVGRYAGAVTFFAPGEPECRLCGPRPPAQPVATEWKPLEPVKEARDRGCFGVRCGDCPISCTVTRSAATCNARLGTYEHRWPSGVIGEGQPEFRRVGTEPAAPEPVATEWAKMSPGACERIDCIESGCPMYRDGNGDSCQDSGYSTDGLLVEVRWPSGIVGEGQPEFRKVEQPTCSACAERFATTKILPQCDGCACSGGDEYAKVETAPAVVEPAPAVVEPKHVHLRELQPNDRTRRHEGPHAECPNCLADFPYEVVDRIDAGTLDCPSCGWHSGRCDHCNTKLVNSYVRGERNHGRRHCPSCQGVDE